MKSEGRRTVHRLFDIGIFLKGIDSVLEGIGGILLIFISPRHIADFFRIIFQHELIEDPKDFVANSIISFAETLSVSVRLFASAYLLVHAIVKISLIIALIKKKLWAYPASEIIFGLFVIYQVYRYFHTHSVFLLVLTAFDLFVMLIIWLEYRNMRR